MATTKQAPQTAEAAPVQDDDEIPALVAPVLEAPKRKAKREIEGIPLGSATVVRDKGYSPTMYEIIMERRDWVPVAVRERQTVGINGVNFVVEGPSNDEAYETVTLPYPIAEALKEQHKHEREATRTWRSRTARSLGGTLDVRER